jgi:hypothetical protein
MTQARNIWRDLVDRRLWPVALLLGIALIAIPVLLSHSSSSAPGKSAVANVSPTAPVAGVAPVASVSSTVAPAGSTRNPFHQQHLPKAPASGVQVTGTVAGTSSGAPGGASGVGAASGAGGVNSATGSSSSSSLSKSTTVTVHRGSARRGSSRRVTRHPKPAQSGPPEALLRLRRAGEPKRLYSLKRLMPLPSRHSPVLVFLGFRDGGRTAVFLVPSSTSPNGEGTCKPVRKVCSTLYLHAGETEYLDVGSASHTVQYVLNYLRAAK